MKLLTFLSLPLFLLLGSGTTPEKQKKPMTINLLDGLKTEKEFKLSEIVDGVEYIKLETDKECLLSSASYSIGKKYILASSRTQIYLFDRKGKYLCKIGTSGQGPGEYLNLDKVATDPDETYILANDYMSGQLLKFDFKGKLIGQIKHKDALGGRAVDVSVKSTDEIFIRMDYPKLEKKSFYLIRKLNRNLVQTDSLYPINSQLISGSKFSFIPADFYLYNGSIRIRQNPSDTLFSESSGKMVPRFIFPIKENHIPGPFLVSGVDKRLGSYTTILSCSEFPGYLILNTVIAPNKIRPMIFNQSSGELFTLKKQPACGSDTLQQRLIINDIDGIGHPALLSPENGLCICSHEIMDLKEEVKALCPNNIKLKYPNRRKELTDMANKSDEGDNPILQIFHVK